MHFPNSKHFLKNKMSFLLSSPILVRVQALLVVLCLAGRAGGSQAVLLSESQGNLGKNMDSGGLQT